MAMKINNTGRHMREGLRNVWRNGWMSVASLSAVVVTLAIVGISLIVAFNVQQMSNYVQGKLEISVFMKSNATTQQGQQLATQIKGMSGVQSVRVITKEQGLKQLESELGKQYADVLSGFGASNNPIPVTLVVKASNPRQELALASRLTHLNGVDDVRDGQGYVNRLYQFIDILRNVGVVFMAVLLLTSMFLISNTIKMTIMSRRREIEIMKLVGATNWFIRWPFLIEGILIGVLGAVIPYLAVTIGYARVFAATGGVFKGLSFPLVTDTSILGRVAILMFGIGIFIGIWGSSMSIRKFLRI